MHASTGTGTGTGGVTGYVDAMDRPWNASKLPMSGSWFAALPGLLAALGSGRLTARLRLFDRKNGWRTGMVGWRGCRDTSTRGFNGVQCGTSGHISRVRHHGFCLYILAISCEISAVTDRRVVGSGFDTRPMRYVCMGMSAIERVWSRVRRDTVKAVQTARVSRMFIWVCAKRGR